ncbi:glycerate kinase [Zootermopsis nevadensis]|uniref:Glycerate kinase n=1 Tax=Zootermopsis nevadensis TaxID=136037 RepID=A0A067RI67_ZOONE|nr:glycerate kinase [Zootermopsis nevadensis]KDR23492.1 Glycerate kinase [Zootermopsis nevadensis]
MASQKVTGYKFLTYSSKYSAIRHIKFDMQSIFDKSLRLVQPDTLLKMAIEVKNDTLIVRDTHYQLNKNCHLIGFGKAVLGMACEAEKILGNHLCSGIISVPKGIREIMKNPTMQPKPDSILEIIEGAKNNLPDQNAEEAARRIKHLVQNLGSNELLIILLSGGGSALLPLPVSPITLQEKCQVVKLLTAAGANIIELNCVRKKLSVLKGGRLAQLAYPAQVVALILSDIVGDPIDLIASGPTVVNSDAPDTALNIIRKYSLLDRVPVSIQMCLSTINTNICQNETLSDSRTFSHVQNLLIGSNLTAITAAAEAASNMNYNTIILSSGIEGLVTDVGRMYATLATVICKALWNTSTPKAVCEEVHEVFHCMKQLYAICDNAEEKVLHAMKQMKNKKGICLIAGGETTVIVKGNGLGGRNQELAMVFARNMNENSKSFPYLDQFHAVLLSADTDGIDGPTNAAGAFGYKHQFHAAIEQDLKSDEYENNNDSYNYYLKLNGGEDLINVGHTGTNVMDMHILVIESIVNSR